MPTINLGRIGLVLKGEYDSTVSYEKLDVVTYNGASYAAKDSVTGVAPTNTSYWQPISERGEKGDAGAKGEKGEKGEQGIPGSSAEALESAQLATQAAIAADQAAQAAERATQSANEATKKANEVLTQAIDLKFYIDNTDGGLNAQILKEGY